MRLEPVIEDTTPKKHSRPANPNPGAQALEFRAVVRGSPSARGWGTRGRGRGKEALMTTMETNRAAFGPTRAGPSHAAAPGLPFSRSSSSFLRRWELATRDREKRQGRRRSLRCQILMSEDTPGGEGTPVAADCLNVGDGGLFAIVPEDVQVSLGQRFRFQLTIGERGPEPGSRQCVSQLGEVIRVELVLDEKGCGDRIGIGVRLFGPRSGIVPMPVSA
jgi:hypothetical protein